MNDRPTENRRFGIARVDILPLLLWTLLLIAHRDILPSVKKSEMLRHRQLRSFSEKEGSPENGEKVKMSSAETV